MEQSRLENIHDRSCHVGKTDGVRWLRQDSVKGSEHSAKAHQVRLRPKSGDGAILAVSALNEGDLKLAATVCLVGNECLFL